MTSKNDLYNTIDDLHRALADSRAETQALLEEKENKNNDFYDYCTTLDEPVTIPGAVAVAVRSVILQLNQRADKLAAKKGISIADIQRYEDEVLFIHELSSWLGTPDEEIDAAADSLWEALSA